jgi:TPR repeat protein
LSHVQAMTSVGWMYCAGIGVRADVVTGVARLATAAALGSDCACWFLGCSYQKGRYGVREDAAEASFYYAKIPGCTVKSIQVEGAAAAAEWLQAHPLQTAIRPAD